MSAVTRSQVIQLYKQLIRYQNKIQLSDKEYFKNRIRDEFRKNSHLVAEEDIAFHFKVSHVNLFLLSIVQLNLLNLNRRETYF